MDKILNSFVEEVQKIFKDRLTTVFLYGSCAVEDCSKIFNDLNVMVVINNLCAKDLDDAHKISVKFAKKAKSLPIFMDEDEWYNSSDIYAMEYSDIKDRHKILFGKDIISDLKVEKHNLRVQCEREVKNLLIRLRQTYLVSSNDKKAIKNLIFKSSKAFVAIFRAILKLLDMQVPITHFDVVKGFSDKMSEENLEFDKDLFLCILDFKKRCINSKQLIEVIQKLIDSTDYVLKYVDKLKV